MHGAAWSRTRKKHQWADSFAAPICKFVPQENALYFYVYKIQTKIFQTKITVFEKQLFGEFAFSDNSPREQRVYIFFKPPEGCRGRMLLGSAPARERRKSLGQNTLLNVPPFQFPPHHWRFSGVYYYLNLPLSAWKYLADFIVSQSPSFSPHSECFKAVCKAGMCQKTAAGSRDYKEAENSKIKSQTFYQAHHWFSSSSQPSIEISQLSGLRALCSTRLIGTDQPGLHIF